MTSLTTAFHRARPLGRIFLAVTVALVVLGSASSAQAATLPEGFSESQYASLARPYQMEFAPDGRLFVTQQGGKLRVIKDGVLLTQPFLSVPVDTAGDRGLIGVAFDPNFETNKYVYVYYTATTPTIHNRVSRFKADGDVAVTGSEEVLIDFETLGTSTTHNGGSIHFGPDGKLYVVTGENAQQGGKVAQSMTSLLGKMLRLNADGSIPVDNPFYATATGKYRAIYALGLRNPFTFAIEPGTGRSFINDVGAQTWEEVNEARAGANYGWPETEGMTSDPRFQSPVYTYGHAFTDTTGCAITGGAFYTTPKSQFPAEYRGDYFFSDYCTGWIRRLDADNGYAPQAFATGVQGPIDMKVGPDGSLYYLTRQDGMPGTPGFVHRVQYSGKPAVSEQPRDVTVAPGHAATFTARASGREPLRYQWQRDGVDIPGATSASYTLSDPTAADHGARFRVVVTNDEGSATSSEATLTVTTNGPPEATVVTPEDGTKYNAGTRVSFAGDGTDPEDGTLPASAFEWDVVFHHHDHTHPGPNIEPGETGDARSGSVVIPDEGETDDDVFYSIHLTVTDSAGQKHSTYRDLKPNLATITLRATPESVDDGLQVTLDGQPVRTPYVTPSVVGVKRVIGAVSPQTLDATDYIFDAWTDGGSATHEIVTPATDSTYAAAYKASAHVDPPDTAIGASPSVTNDSTPEFTFGSSEPGSTFECKVDGGAFEPCSSPTTLPTQADGQHVFYVRAVKDGRTDPTPASHTFTVDTIKPKVSVSSPVAGATVAGTIDLAANANDSGGVTGVKWYVDGVQVASDYGGAPWEKPWDSATVADGTHKVSAKARDAAGNWGASVTLSFTVDNSTPSADPDTTITSAPTTTTDPTPDFAFSSDMADSTFECKVDGGAFELCSSPTTLPTQADGQHVFYVRAINGGRTDPTPASHTFTVDTALVPDTTITSGPGDTSDRQADFAFSAIPATAASSECRLISPGDANPAFGACASPKSYTNLADGNYTFEVRAKNTGGTDQTPASRAFMVNVPSGPTCHGRTATVAGTTGTAGDDVIVGTPAAETIHAGAGNDTICAGAGTDRIGGGSGTDTIDGGPGFDTLDGGSGTDNLDGGDGSNGVDYKSRATGMRVDLAAGDARPVGASTKEDTLLNISQVYGSPQADVFFGTNENRPGDGYEFLMGNSGNDSLSGRGGVDWLRGGDGNDSLLGGAGNDKQFTSRGRTYPGLDGGAGNDTLDGGTGTEVVSGGAGTDTATYATRTTGVAVSLNNRSDDGNSSDGPSGGRDNVRTDVEKLTGGSAADSLRAVLAGAVNVLRGNAGNDRLKTDDGRGGDGLVCGTGTDLHDSDASDSRSSCERRAQL